MVRVRDDVENTELVEHPGVLVFQGFYQLMIAFWSAPDGFFLKGISAVCAQIERFNSLRLLTRRMLRWGCVGQMLTSGQEDKR